MESLKLKCPLCCDKFFSSRESLKLHILGAVGNLHCPICNKQFDKIRGLTDHLEEECSNNEQEEDVQNATSLHEEDMENTTSLHNSLCEVENATSLHDEGVENATSLLEEDVENATSLLEEEVENATNLLEEDVENATSLLEEGVENATTLQETVIEKETNSNQIANNNLLAKALLAAESDNEIRNVEVSEDIENGDDSYFCSSCSISFPSIEEHLQKFHEGDAVLLDDGVSTIVDSEGKVYFDNDLKTGDDVVENDVLLNDENSSSKKLNLTIDSEDEDMEDLEEILMKTQTIKPTETLKQEDCYDKDGRLYIRKMVKIEKFWADDVLHNKEAPSIENYLLDGDKAIKLTIEEVKKLNDKTKLLELYRCKICLQQYSKEDYLCHNCISSQSNYRHKCYKCSLIFESTKLYLLHKKKCENVSTDDPNLPELERNTCKICNTDFPTFKSLRLHKRMHDPVKIREAEAPVPYGITGENDQLASQESREMFTCHICHKTYDLQYKTVHISSHSTEDNFDCNICNRKFYTKINLDMHMRVHSNEKKFVCSYCKKSFLTFKSMTDHIKNLCQSRKYECQFCGRRFARPHEKVKHERIHTGEKPHVCEICGKSFRVSYCLTLHMRTHSGTRPYQCPHCGKRFKAHSVYNHHLLTHSEKRNYKCPYCPKAFKTGVQLAGHKNSHTKPFTCNQCNRPFASLYAVRTHMETHKRENNLKYSCWLCGASYAREFALRDHLKEQHPEEVDINTVEILHHDAIDTSNAILVQADEETLIQLEEAAAVIKIEVPNPE